MPYFQLISASRPTPHVHSVSRLAHDLLRRFVIGAAFSRLVLLISSNIHATGVRHSSAIPLDARKSDMTKRHVEYRARAFCAHLSTLAACNQQI